jgi:hypothetical protein
MIALRTPPRAGFLLPDLHARIITVALLALLALQKPLMKVVGGDVHERSKKAAIESGRRSAIL